MSEQRELTVESGDAGARLDVYVARCLEGVSRARVQKLIAAGQVLLNGQPAIPRTSVSAGDQIWVNLELLPSGDGGVRPQEIPFEVVYHDQHLAVVNKPRGLTVHPGSGRPDSTLVNALAARFGDLPEGSAPERPGIVHRLDKDTSGLMVVALRAETMTALSAMVAERHVQRIYQALVWGSPRFEKAVVDASIGRDPRHPERMAVLPDEGPSPSRAAVTELQVLERFTDVTLLEAHLRTGRTHQIRVHCAYAGHDVVGDSVYGHARRLSPEFSARDRDEFDRLLAALDGQALHAWKLSFRHPVTGQDLSFLVDPPRQMQDVIGFFRTHSGGGERE